jgi:hypothetical protein
MREHDLCMCMYRDVCMDRFDHSLLYRSKM